ncbi:uncharacterized protein [Anabrus simplex]|uniref:uncharacterized protein n=1 Tax=Anabrus simplex TaxID=316456 RepID=UPI0035A2DB5D
MALSKTCNLFFVLAVSLSMFAAIMCEWTETLKYCPHDICTRVDCSDNPTSCPDGAQLVPNTTYCGCCSSCILFIEYGMKCGEYRDDLPYTMMCRPPNSCVNGKCRDLRRLKRKEIKESSSAKK